MSEIRSLCVFCGSSKGSRQDYVDSSKAIADVMLEHDIQLVYGGAHVGIMGALADNLLREGGKVVGVIPQALVELEVAHDGLTELHIVNDMHERKAMMAERADAFMALPGGLGTLEELFEVLTWAQLGIHQKPVGLLNVAGFYDKLLEFLDHAADEVFMRQNHRALLLDDSSAAGLIQTMLDFKPIHTPKLDAVIQP